MLIMADMVSCHMATNVYCKLPTQSMLPSKLHVAGQDMRYSIYKEFPDKPSWWLQSLGEYCPESINKANKEILLVLIAKLLDRRLTRLVIALSVDEFAVMFHKPYSRSFDLGCAEEGAEGKAESLKKGCKAQDCCRASATTATEHQHGCPCPTAATIRASVKVGDQGTHA